MASQLSRVGRSALPLLQQLERAVPGAWQQFSSAAESSPAGGRGRGPAGGSGSGKSGPPRGKGRGGPREQGGTGSGGARQPGAMSELLAGGRPPRREGGEGGYRGRRGEGGPRRFDRERALHRTGGPSDEPDLEVRFSPEEEHLNDTPHDILLKFRYALRDASKPGEEFVPLSSLDMDIGDIANLDHLRLAKYYMTPRQWAAFSSGRMDEDEQNVLMDRLAAALLGDDRYWQRRANIAAMMAADPDYDLPASVGSRPALRGTPRPAPPTVQQLGQALEEQKEALMAQYGLSEEEWATAKEATARQQAAQAHAAACAHPLPNLLALEQRLAALLDRAMPADHPNYALVKKRLEVLQGNPGWSHERKMVFAKRLIKRLAATS